MQQQEMAISQEPTSGSGSSNSSSVQDMDAADENPPKAAAAAAAAAASRSSCSRRPRVREVSSRFMSPAVSSTSSSSSASVTDLHLSSAFSTTAKCLLPPMHQHHHHQRSQSVNRRHPPSSPIHSNSESEPLSSSSSSNSLIIVRNSLDTPLPGFHHHPTKRSLFASNKLLHLKENGDPHLSHSSSNLKFPPRNTSSSAAALPIPHRRTDTPTVPRSIQNFPTPATSSRSKGFALATTTAAAKLVQSTGLAAPKRNAPHEDIQRNYPTPTKSSSANDHRHAAADAADSSVSCDSPPPPPPSDTCTIKTSQRGFCDSPPIPMQIKKNPNPISDFRSSMPEADLLPTMSARIMGEDDSNDASFSSGDFCRMAASPCHRSLNSALSSCHQSSSPTKSFSRTSLLTKSQSGSVKPGAICLPPNPSNIKSGVEAKKSRKPSNHQDDVHSLRMLHSRYLQWRLANAKAEAAMDFQRIEAEQSLHSVMAKVSAMRESVVAKRIELEQLMRIERLSTIVDSQLPYLAEWAVLEEDYSSCLSGAINALNDSLTYLPVVGNVRADATELSESLSSAINVLEAILPNVQYFLPKLQGVDHVISELAGVVSRERAIMEECEALLSKANTLQVEECSLRGQLIQLKRGSHM